MSKGALDMYQQVPDNLVFWMY